MKTIAKVSAFVLAGLLFTAPAMAGNSNSAPNAGHSAPPANAGETGSFGCTTVLPDEADRCSTVDSILAFSGTKSDGTRTRPWQDDPRFIRAN